MSAEEGLNFQYYTKVGNRVLQIMQKIEQAVAEKLIENAEKLKKPHLATKISAYRARKLR